MRSWCHPDEVEWSATIEVPFAPETPRERHRRRQVLPACWYRRTVDRRRAPLEHRRLLALRRGRLPRDGLDQRVRSRIARGRLHAVHDRSAAVHAGHPPSIVVRAEDDPSDLAKPRGKQDWQLEPHSIWYPRTTGIWQTVWLETVPSDLDRAHALDAESRTLGDRTAKRGSAGCARETSAARRQASRGRHAARRRHLHRDRRRGPSADCAVRSGHRRLPQRAAVEPGNADADRRPAPALGRPRRAARRSRELHGAALGRRRPRPLRAQRPPLPSAHGARPGLLAGQRADGARRRRAAARRRAGQGDGLQRRAQAPEDRGSALPLLGRQARPARLGRNAERLSLHRPLDPARQPRVDRRDRARHEPSVHRRVGAVQRVLGRAEPARRARRTALRAGVSTT